MIILNRRMVKTLYQKVNVMERKLERANIAEFMRLLQKPTRLIYLNFLGGLARGFGIAIGLTIIASLFLVFLTKLAELNLPVIGEYIANLVRIVNFNLKNYY